jgi:hypothetical protein
MLHLDIISYCVILFGVDDSNRQSESQSVSNRSFDGLPRKASEPHGVWRPTLAAEAVGICQINKPPVPQPPTDWACTSALRLRLQRNYFEWLEFEDLRAAGFELN